jgi:hypothetical protein
MDLVAVGSEEEEAQMDELLNDGNGRHIILCTDPYYLKCD